MKLRQDHQESIIVVMILTGGAFLFMNVIMGTLWIWQQLGLVM